MLTEIVSSKHGRNVTEALTVTVYVAVGLGATAGVHTDGPVLPLRQRPLGGQVAGDIGRDDGLIWEMQNVLGQTFTTVPHWRGVQINS